MTAIVAMFLAIAAPGGAGAVAQGASQVAASPLPGTWSVDVARMPIPAAERPKSVTITFRDAGSKKWTMEVMIDTGGGSPLRATSTFALDGAPAPAIGTPEADTIAAKLPVPNVLVVSLGKGGAQASTRIYAVAPGGRSMIETATYYRDGAPVMRTNYFTRLAGK